MDVTDFRLLAVLNENARQSLQALGRRVSLSAPAVRDRLRRLEARGIIQGYWVAFDPAIFGREDLLISFDKDWTREEALRALDAPDVAWVAWKVEGGLTIQVWPQDAKRAVETIPTLLGRRPNWHAVAQSGWSGALSGADWRILDALVDAPLDSVENLADVTGLTPKTVRKRLTNLLRREAIFVVPHLGLPTDSGVLAYNLAVFGTAPFADLKRRIGDAVLMHETKDPPAKYLFCRADSLGELTATTRALERLSGVSSVRLTLNREMIMKPDFVHVLIREQLAKRD